MSLSQLYTSHKLNFVVKGWISHFVKSRYDRIQTSWQIFTYIISEDNSPLPHLILPVNLCETVNTENKQIFSSHKTKIKLFSIYLDVDFNPKQCSKQTYSNLFV